MSAGARTLPTLKEPPAALFQLRWYIQNGKLSIPIILQCSKVVVGIATLLWRRALQNDLGLQIWNYFFLLNTLLFTPTLQSHTATVLLHLCKFTSIRYLISHVFPDWLFFSLLSLFGGMEPSGFIHSIAFMRNPFLNEAELHSVECLHQLIHCLSVNTRSFPLLAYCEEYWYEHRCDNTLFPLKREVKIMLFFMKSDLWKMVPMEAY